MDQPSLPAEAIAPLPDLRTLLRTPKGYARLLRTRLRHRLSRGETRPATLALLGVAGLMIVVLVCWTVLFLHIPHVGRLVDTHMAEATIAYTADGQELTRYHLENRTWVPLDSIAPTVVEALVATEDHRFYEHHGIDLPRVAGAIFRTASGDRQGGSTITMQLARNIYPDIHDDPLLLRKVREWLTALRLEDLYTKDEILAMYLNAVPFMYDAFGIQAGALTYFQKPAAELNLLESATLIGMLKGTVYYNPVRHPERAQARRNVVLSQMVRNGYLDEATYASVQDQPTELHFSRITRAFNQAPFFAEYVRQWLGAWAEENGYNLYTGGLRVYTTLDAGLQDAAEAAVADVVNDLQAVVDVEWSRPDIPYFSRTAASYQDARAQTTPFAYFWEAHPNVLRDLLMGTSRYRRLRGDGLAPDSALSRLRADTAYVDSLKQIHQRLDAGFVAIDPTNGHVKAWVGGRSFEEDEFDHVALARRQPGSTFKPFVYVAALENGYAPHNVLADRPLNYVDPATGQRWNPSNFGAVSGNLYTLPQALAYSKNTITARLITDVGADEVVRYAQRMGIHSPLQAVPSLGLGTSDVTLLEMTSAYTTLANRGVHQEPVIITRIEDRNGQVLATFEPDPEQAIPAHTAYAVLDMMRGVVDYGTGVRIRSLFGAQGELAGKTGTTQRGADGWFMLVHPNLVMGAWVGFSSPSLTFRSSYWGQGSHTALHVVGDFYRQARRQGASQLSPEATFGPAPDYHWGPGRMTDTDALNRHERQSNKLDDLLRRLREQKRQRTQQ